MADQKKKEFFPNKTIKRTGMIIGLVLLVLGILVLGFNLTYKDRIMPKTYIGGVNLGGKTKAEASQVLQTRLSAFNESVVELKYQDQSWRVSSKDFNVKYKVDASVNEAWTIGRVGSFKEIVLEQLKAVFLGNREGIVITYDQSKLNDRISEITNKIDRPEKDATIEIKNLVPEVSSEKSGLKVDFYQATNDVLTSFQNLKDKSSFNVQVISLAPKVKYAAADQAATQVKNILTNTIVLKSDKQTLEVKPEQFASWLSFVGQSKNDSLAQKIDLKNAGNSQAEWSLVVMTDPAKVNGYIDSITGGINQEAKDAKFQVQDGKVTAFQNSQVGYELDKTKTYQMISDAILGETKTVTLPVKVTQPKVTSESINQMGLNELVGDGKTSWKGSPSNRIHNLTLGSQKISGTIVQPGAEFSTVKTIGVIDGSTGFLPELVIKNSTQVVPEFGGGLCQVSTTLFRAALNAGLNITERTNHSFRVSYYEPPVGMDATIYDPAPDFKFVNNYSTPILIWAIAGQNTLEFQIYGTKDNRKVEISDPSIFNYTNPPGPVYTKSVTMAAGAVRQVERATRGCTASFTYKVTDVAGKVLQAQTFVSKYVPLPNSYLYGEGYTPPSG